MLEVGFAANPLQGYISGYQSHRRTILVIDDVDENHMVVCDMLEQIGFEQQDAFG